MVQALPQYTEQVDKISLHVEVCFFLNTVHEKALSFNNTKGRLRNGY